MIASSSSGPLVIWLLIATVFYAALWFACIRRFGMVGTCLFSLGFSAMLSPGILAGGHGAIPFPGGVAFLLDGLGGDGGPIADLNLMMWLLTFAIFSVCSWLLKRFETPDKTSSLT